MQLFGAEDVLFDQFSQKQCHQQVQLLHFQFEEGDALLFALGEFFLKEQVLFDFENFFFNFFLNIFDFSYRSEPRAFKVNFSQDAVDAKIFSFSTMLHDPSSEFSVSSDRNRLLINENTFSGLITSLLRDTQPRRNLYSPPLAEGFLPSVLEQIPVEHIPMP